MRANPDSPGTGAVFTFERVRVEVPGAGRPLLDVDLSFPDHGATAILGPSGAGKTTLLRLCNRLDAPTAGRVLFRGADIAALDPLEHRQRVGLVAQRAVPFPGTVSDNVRVGSPRMGETAVLELLDRVGLDREYRDRDASELSGGEMQRVGLARTLATGPEVLLLDEPTSALDPARTAVVERIVSEVVAAGGAALWVTHDLAQATRVASHLLALEAGRAVFQGTPTELASSPDPVLVALREGVRGEGS